MNTLRNTTLNLLASYIPSTQERNVSTTKVLRALIEFAPTPKGCDNVCHEILGCYSATTGKLDSPMLDELADRYRTRLLIPMTVQGGKTPVATMPPSRPSADLDSAINESMIENAKHDAQKLKILALQRDGFRSLMTEKFDMESVKRSLVKCDPKVDVVTLTHASHILPFALMRTHSQPEEVRNKSDIWQIISHFSGADILDELAGPNISRLENVLTLGVLEHLYFGKLEIWFEATDEPNAYFVRGRSDMNGIFTKDKLVRFQTRNKLIPLPSPRYLALHAACAQVIHTCGLGEYIDGIMVEIKDLPVLPEDGSSNALVNALHRVPVY